MAAIIPFKRKKNTNDNLNAILGFLRHLILDPEPSRDRMEFTMDSARLNVQLIERSYEEERLKFFAENKIMAAGGLTSLMMLTPEAFRNELFDVAAIDVQLWEKIPHVEHFITARHGGFEYNFRTVNHDIAQAMFDLVVFDRTKG